MRALISPRRFRIPTFEELLKGIGIKKPAVSALAPVLDVETAKPLGFNLPFGWKLKRDPITGDTLISPRGHLFSNLKLNRQGRIVGFEETSLDGKPILPKQPALSPFSAVSGKVTPTHPFVEPPPGFKMPEGELRPLIPPQPKIEEWILRPNELKAPKKEDIKTQADMRKLEYSALGLTASQYLQLIDSWIRDLKPEDKKEYFELGERYTEYGWVANPLEFVRLEVADIVGFRELGLSSDKAHELADRLFPGLRKRIVAESAQPLPSELPAGETKKVPTFSEWSTTKGFDMAEYGSMLRQRGIAEADIPEMLLKTQTDLRDVYEFEFGLGKWGKVGGELEKIAIAEPQRLLEVGKVLGQSLTKVPKQVGASILQAGGVGGASVVDKDWRSRLIQEAQTDLDKFAQEISEKYPDSKLMESLAQLPQNIAFSLTSMGAGVATGVPIALLPVPGARIAAWGVGSAASGLVAYNMASYQIMQQYLEAKNEEMIAIRGSGITADEERQLKADFEGKARAYGLWEAVPEAISNLAFARILTAPLTRIAGRSIAARIVEGLTTMYGQELLTETITQKGQSAIEVEAGLREGRISWTEAFKEVAPQTFLLTTILGGVGSVSIASVNKVKQSLKTEIGSDHPLYQTLLNGINERLTEVLQEGAMEQGGLGRPAPIISKLATPELTAQLKNAQDIAKKAGFDLEAVQGIAPDEYWVAISRNSKPEASDLRLEWLKNIPKKAMPSEQLDKLGEVVELIKGRSRQLFYPFKTLADAQKFLATGDTSLITRELRLRGEPLSPEKLAEIRRAAAKEPKPFTEFPPKPFRPFRPGRRGLTEEQAEARLAVLQAKMTPEEREQFQISVREEPVAEPKPPVTPEVTREQLVEQYKKIATRHSPEVIDYVSKLSNEEVDALYRGKPAETITIAGKKYYKTTLASIKGELDNYIGGVEKQRALPKAEAVVTPAPEVTKADITPTMPESYVQAKKRPDGKWQLFFTGTRNEVFPNELFASASEAKIAFRVAKAKSVTPTAPAAPEVTIGEIPKGFDVSFKGERVGMINTYIPKGEDALLVQRLTIDKEGIVNKGFLQSLFTELVNEARAKGLKYIDIIPRDLKIPLYNRLFSERTYSTGVNVARIEVSKITPTGRVTPEVTREPWQMTYREFFDIAGSEYTAGSRFGIQTVNKVPAQWGTKFGQKGATPEERIHRSVIEKALSEGKPVPAEVLKDYPDLAVTPTAPAVEPITPEVTSVEAGRIEVEQSLERVNKRIGEIRENLKTRTGTRANRAWQNNELARYNQQKADYERLLKENNPEELSRYAPREVAIPKAEAGMPEVTPAPKVTKELTLEEFQPVHQKMVDRVLKARRSMELAEKYGTSEQNREARTELINAESDMGSGILDIAYDKYLQDIRRGKPVTPTAPAVEAEPIVAKPKEVAVRKPPAEPPIEPPVGKEPAPELPPEGRPRTLTDLNREAKGMRALSPEERAGVMDMAKPIDEGELLYKVKPFNEHGDILLQPDKPINKILRSIPGIKQATEIIYPAQMERDNPVALIGIKKRIFEEIETGRARLTSLKWWYNAKKEFDFKKVKGKWRATNVALSPKADTKKPYHATIHDLVEHPENYEFTPEQEKILKVAQDMQSQILRDAQRVGVDAVELSGNYWRRIVTKAPKNALFDGKIKSRITSKKGYTRQRAFDFVDDGAALGFEYETHPLRSLQNRLEAGIRTISDQNARKEIAKLPGVVKTLERLESRYPQTLEGVKTARQARDIAKQTFLRDKTIENETTLRQAEADYVNSMRELYFKKIAAGQPNIGELKLPNGRIAPVELAEEISRWIELPEIRTGRGSITNPVLGVTQLLRSTLTNVDLAAGFIQGQALFYRNNPAWWVGQGNAILSLVDDRMAYVEKNFDMMDEGMRMGAISIPTEFMFTTQGIASIPTRVPIVGPVMKAFNRAFEWFIVVGQTEMYKTARSGVIRRASGANVKRGEALERQSIEALASLGSAIRKEMGTESYAILGVRPTQHTIEQLVLFAARFFRACTGIQAQAFTGGEGGREARRAMGSLIAGGLALLIAISWAKDKKLPNMTDPFAPGWMMVKIGKTYFSTFGPFYPYFRAQARASVRLAQGHLDEAVKVIARFLESKEGLLFRGIDMAAQFSMYGSYRTFEGKRLPATPAGITEAVLGEMAVPISIQEAMTALPEGRYESAIAEIAGLVGRPAKLRASTEAISNLGKVDQEALDQALVGVTNASRIAEIKAKDWTYDIQSLRRDIAVKTRYLLEEDIAKLEPIVGLYWRFAESKDEYELLSTREKELYLKDNPDFVTQRLFWGDISTIPDLKTAKDLDAQANKYSILLDHIPAFKLTEEGKERIPTDKTLWPSFFEYNALPGTSYLNMTQEQIDAGELPEKYRAQWEQYHKLKTDTARGFFRAARSNREAARSDWREQYRRDNPEFDRWLQDNKGLKPLKKAARVVPAPTRGITVATLGGGGRVGRISPRRGTIKVPKFPKPRLAMSIGAPRAPRV